MFLARLIKTKAKQEGFTLLEMLVSVFLFAVMTLAISGIYVGFTSLQARSRSYERLLNDSNYVVELMAKEFRTNTIFDYTPSDSCTTLLGADHPEECMIFVRADGKLEAFMVYGPTNSLYFITPTCQPDYVSCTWADNVQNYTVLLAPELNGIEVDDLLFKIVPSSDPFVSDTGVNRQPMITMQLQTTYPGVNVTQNVSQSLQTTVSARIYKR